LLYATITIFSYCCVYMCMVFIVDECMVNIFETCYIIMQRKLMCLNLRKKKFYWTMCHHIVTVINLFV
jgi:hypothetical protein